MTIRGRQLKLTNKINIIKIYENIDSNVTGTHTPV